LPVIAVIHSFLDVAFGPTAPELAALGQALDELALVSHTTPAGAPSDRNIEPPPVDQKATRTRIEARFSALGLYGVADPLELSGEPMVGDAIDDIADIADEVSAIVWRWDNLGPEDACWHFHQTYRVHWGRHLRELQSYLHALLFCK